MKKPVAAFALLLLTGSQAMAASDAEVLYASLYGDQQNAVIQPVSYDAEDAEDKAPAAWTQAMQGAWGKTRPLSELSQIQKEVVREVKDVINHPVVKGVKRNVPADIDAVIKKYASQYDISEDLIKALIQQESSFNPKAVSKVGAQGLMQLMPVHTKGKGIDPFDPDQNIKTGIGFLSHLLKKYGDLELALAAYNAGEGAVDKYGGIPPYKETQLYVKKIMATLGG